MYKTLQHLNGDIFASIDVETTGGIAGFHEVIQIAILPLDSNLNEIEVMPFNLKLKPDHPERASKEAMRVTGLKLDDLARTGCDRFVACDLLRRWFDETLHLGYNKYGTKRCRIRPMGHNYAGFDEVMVRSWLEECGEEYTEFFYPQCADTMIEGGAVNNKLAMRGKDIKFKSLGLGPMCTEMGVEYEKYKHHDALYDTRITAKLFKKLMTTDIVGLL